MSCLGVKEAYIFRTAEFIEQFEKNSKRYTPLKACAFFKSKNDLMHPELSLSAPVLGNLLTQLRIPIARVSPDDLTKIQYIEYHRGRFNHDKNSLSVEKPARSVIESMVKGELIQGYGTQNILIICDYENNHFSFNTVQTPEEEIEHLLQDFPESTPCIRNTCCTIIFFIILACVSCSTSYGV